MLKQWIADTAAVQSPSEHVFSPTDGLTCRNSYVTEFNRNAGDLEAGAAAKAELVQLF